MTYSSKQLSSLPGEHRVAGQPPTCLSQPHQSKSWSPLAYRLPAAFLILILLCMPFDRPDRLTAHLLPALTPLNLEAITTGSAPKCLPQHTIHPQHNQNLDNAYLHLHSHDFANSSLAHWQALIQVDTQSFDQQGPVKDNPEQYQHFKHFDVALRKHFPLVFQRLHLEMVNTYGAAEQALMRFQMAHSDVVPVGDAADWTYPPFSGHYDGEFVWGRGSLDDKSPLAAILEAATALLEAGFEPERDILFAFGFDEELNKVEPEGALPIARRIEERYGQKGLEMVVDEGGLGLVSLPGGHTVYALPSTSEKGYLDIKVTVKAQGGHSSEPPDHTGIGIMSALVGRLEDRPHQPNLTVENPMMQWLYCLASDPALDDITRQYIFEAAYSQQGRDKLAHRIVTFFPQYRSAITTTQAADVIEGGVKANALPEEVTLTINHRLALHDSIEELKTHIFHLFLPVAERFDLPLHAYSGVSPHEHGIYLEALSPLEPAPISTFKSEAWSKFSATVRRVFGQHVVVVPSVMPGNTDTTLFHRLSDNIYRFTPFTPWSNAGIHGVDERATLSSHIDVIKYYFELMRSVCGHSKVT